MILMTCHLLQTKRIKVRYFRMQLFDYIKVLFGTDQQWDDLSSYDKSKNNFMTNRFMSIKFPIQADLFNGLKTDPIGQAESWRLVARKFSRVPSFIYTKVSQKNKKQKEWSPDPKALEFYMRVNEIGMREFEFALKQDPETVMASIDKLKSHITDDRDI
jgi:hypothetical protein